MAYIEKTAFEPRITNNEYNELCNITGRYQVSDADADCSAGLLVVRGEQLPCAGFKGIKNENAFYMNAAGAAANADTGVYACNTYEWPTLGGRNGNNYAVGTATLGLGVPAGRDGTFTEIVFDGKHAYRFGEGNLSTAIGENTIFTIANGLLVPAAAAPTATGAIYFKLKGTGNFTEGAGQSFVYYDVWACKVSTVTA
jgi:hypothetical protein|nr:MAG TPA: hypothetical protein [Caudoviricetes sp.]DAH22328.1 MAG TPA: hypothetical protein [Caudoviricetes sp.]DAJ84627.1 MAG TPA: hypothetical protein [Caudoviricetes sp.]DAQ48582.1 MAG TPA: hypothetical protein [Caudoviricetes sp.]